jgi:hypothetical protein
MSEIARGRSSGGDLVLSRSDDGALELRVNGVLVMSSAETSTEDLLAEASWSRWRRATTVRNEHG